LAKLQPLPNTKYIRTVKSIKSISSKIVYALTIKKKPGQVLGAGPIRAEQSSRQVSGKIPEKYQLGFCMSLANNSYLLDILLSFLKGSINSYFKDAV